MLVNCNLLDAAEALQGLQRLQLLRRWSVKGLDCDGHNMYQPDQAFATAVSEHLDAFYAQLPHRSAQMRDARQRETTLKWDLSGRVVDNCESDLSARGLPDRSCPLDHQGLPMDKDPKVKTMSLIKALIFKF